MKAEIKGQTGAILKTRAALNWVCKELWLESQKQKVETKKICVLEDLTVLVRERILKPLRQSFSHSDTEKNL